MTWYLTWVSEHPLWSAAVQFGLLGTLGEMLSTSLRVRRLTLPGSGWQTCAKVLAWGLLGIIIKYGFAGIKGFILALLEHQMLPQIFASGMGWALAVSVLTNLFFGPQLIFFHRLEDNLIAWKWNFDGLTTAWWTLLWFWIPAHTITFSLPTEFQIGLAALWSVALGFILGFVRNRHVD